MSSKSAENAQAAAPVYGLFANESVAVARNIPRSVELPRGCQCCAREKTETFLAVSLRVDDSFPPLSHRVSRELWVITCRGIQAHQA